jgi:hypothetical protein
LLVAEDGGKRKEPSWAIVLGVPSGDCKAERRHGFKEAAADIDECALDTDTGADIKAALIGPRTGDTGDAGKMVVSIKTRSEQTMRPTC